MGRVGVISVIPKDFSNAFPTQETSLRQAGMSLFPGTHKYIYPYRENSGVYRTGLDPNALYIRAIKDSEARNAEIKRVTDLRNSLEERTGLDLGPTSKYWQSVNPIKLGDGDTTFHIGDDDGPAEAIMFAWLRVHPTIASSLEEYNAGNFPPDTHFYVKDKDREETLVYNKVKALNEAIAKLDLYDLPKRRKIARLVGLPVEEDMKEEVVYNLLDSWIKQGSVKEGPYEQRDAVEVFNSFSKMSENHIEIKDLVIQAIRKNIYRLGRGNKIERGGLVVFQSQDEMVTYYLDPHNQKELLDLEQQLKVKSNINDTGRGVIV